MFTFHDFSDMTKAEYQSTTTKLDLWTRLSHLWHTLQQHSELHFWLSSHDLEINFDSLVVTCSLNSKTWRDFDKMIRAYTIKDKTCAYYMNSGVLLVRLRVMNLHIAVNVVKYKDKFSYLRSCTAWSKMCLPISSWMLYFIVGDRETPYLLNLSRSC